jgi:hypothetical protein
VQNYLAGPEGRQKGDIVSIQPTQNEYPADPYSPDEITEEGFPEDDFIEEELGEEYLRCLDEAGIYSEEWNEEAPSLDSRQKRLLKWMDTHDDEFQKSVEGIQNRYENLLEGEENLDTGERLEKLKSVESMLKELEEDLEVYDQKEKLLVRTGLAKDWVRSQSEGAPATEDLKEIKKNLNQLDQELKSTAQKESEAAAKDLQRVALSQQSRGLIDHISGTNGKQLYFSAKADGKNVKEVYRKDSRPVEMIFTHIADALKADNEPGWETLNQYLRGLVGGQGQSAAVLATTIIQENLPELWDQLPAASIRNLAQGMTTAEYMNTQRIYKYEGSVKNFMGDSYWVNTRVLKNRGRDMPIERGMNSKEAFDFLTDLAIRKEKETEPSTEPTEIVEEPAPEQEIA